MLKTVLQQVVVPPSANLNDIAIIIEGMNVDIVFHESELLPLEVKKQNEAFMIIVKVDKWNIKRTLIDNGSTLNVCIVKLLDKIRANKI
jgi:hypothetical protein